MVVWFQFRACRVPRARSMCAEGGRRQQCFYFPEITGKFPSFELLFPSFGNAYWEIFLIFEKLHIRSIMFLYCILTFSYTVFGIFPTNFPLFHYNFPVFKNPTGKISQFPKPIKKPVLLKDCGGGPARGREAELAVRLAGRDHRAEGPRRGVHRKMAYGGATLLLHVRQ